MQTHDGASHPTTFQEAKGHGAYRWNGSNFPGGDGVVYFPHRTTAEVPSSGNDRFVRYTLVNIFATNGLWAHRCSTATFTGCGGAFRGDNGSENAANPPWRWNDHDDGGALLGGEHAKDPAKLVSIYFGNKGVFSRTYTRNGYLPPPPPPPPPPCPGTQKCCEPAPDGGCDLCIPLNAQCP